MLKKFLLLCLLSFLLVLPLVSQTTSPKEELTTLSQNLMTDIQLLKNQIENSKKQSLTLSTQIQNLDLSLTTAIELSNQQKLQLQNLKQELQNQQQLLTELKEQLEQSEKLLISYQEKLSFWRKATVISFIVSVILIYIGVTL